ncbi:MULTISPECIES: phospholipase D-like domain-containing protein [Methylosinus]|uniref:Phospholipase D n=1 Tax=Methylosinus trichosporium (strain ATCC 35070 / NCIMB 11131 / UNIQEM 75 / OB3b) TaxID=595536 RepID=A0A2D2CYN4_METT3|nr:MULTISPECIES: phospholipase D-like domain-containing protein [Methylosinus]ATQ67860.1 hypothetical protein CQW49_08080 [Methylosinus trichosporium OB3b]OBS50719.1 hypothetical protein A8B73_20205 [Methylosinus sp. 3S-1]
MSEAVLEKISDAVRNAFAPVLPAVAAARAKLSADATVIAVRPGYAYPATGAPIPAVVVAVQPGTATQPASALAAELGVPVVIADATVEEQLAKEEPSAPSFGAPGAPTSAFERLIVGDEALAFAPPKTGAYTPPEPPNLPLVKERMQLTVCVSPEAGWSELESFLGETRRRLTVAMYQFTAPHIFDAVKAAVAPAGREFELVLHPVPEKPPSSGVKADDLEEVAGVVDPLSETLKSRFELAWATLHSRANPDGLWASAYHIKVAVRDGDAVWCSSGNWQSSNQPNIRLFGPQRDRPPVGFQRKYNRDYHAIIVDPKIASIFEGYIARDHDLAAAQAAAAQPSAEPDLFVPEEPEAPAAFARPPRYFEPLRLDREVSVQPLLTPDNYAEHALELIRSARESVRFQNQYINFRGTNEDFAEFKLLVGALKSKIDASVDVRIICRDLMKQESLDILIALGFPKETFRFQPACHNKTIIVDGKRVMFGSHNWSNEGVKTNRDASLVFDDEEIAQYLAEIYDYDWDNLATAHPAASRPRVAHSGDPTPAGMRRVSYSAVYDE